jgi:MFS family permease
VSEATTVLLKNRIYLFLLAVVFLMHLASYLVIPIFPIFLQKTRMFSIGQVGIILGMSSIAYQAGSLLGGLLADRYGRRNVLIAGALTQGTAMIGYATGQSYLLYLFFATVNGLGLGLLAPTLKAMIADAVAAESRTKAFSWRGIVAHSGIIIAGLLVTWMTIANQRLFLFAAAFFMLVATVARISLPYDRCEGADCRTVPAREYKQILRHKSFLLFSAISLLIWALYAQFGLVMPLRAEHVLDSGKLVGLLWTFNSLGVVLLQGTISRFVLERINPYLSLVAGTLLLGLGLFCLGWADRFLTLCASSILFILGEMLFMPVLDSLVGHFSREEWLGVYFGISNFVSGIGAAIGASVGGSMVERLGGVASPSPWIVYGFTTILFGSLLGLFARYAMTRHGRGVAQKTFTPVLGEKEKAK